MPSNEFVASVEESMSRGKRDRNLNSKISTITWNGKLETDMEIRRREQRSSEIALYESHRELESQRLQLHQANQWTDQAQREKINLCGELEMSSRLLSRKSHKDLPRS